MNEIKIQQAYQLILKQKEELTQRERDVALQESKIKQPIAGDR